MDEAFIEPAIPIDAAIILSRQGHDMLVIETLRRGVLTPGEPLGDAEVDLRARALALIGQSLVRLGRYEEAMRAYAQAPRKLSGPGHAEAQAHILAGAGFAYTHLAMPEEATRMAMAAFRIAFSNGLTILASHALECVGICHAMRGELDQAERLMLESLGVALQSGDDATMQRRISNLLYLMQNVVDIRREAGDPAAELDAMSRCGRFIAQGDRLAPRVGVYERCLWRSNRAGWLRRKGLRVEARAEFEAVVSEGEAHGWVTLVANARFELVQLLRSEHQDAAEMALLTLLTASGQRDADSYDTRLRAHALIAERLAQRGDAAAEAHRARYRELARRRDAQRKAAAQVLAHASSAIIDALAEADRVRIDAERDLLRVQQGAARAARFLTIDVKTGACADS